MIILRPTSRRSRTSTCSAADRLSCRSPYNRADDLCGAGSLDLLDFADYSLVDSCTDRTRSKASSCDLAHDAADDGVDGNLPAAAVVGEVMGEAEGFFAEGLGKLLLLFNLLLVKDASKLVQSVVRITIEGRDILCGILTNINRSPCYSRTGRAVRIALGRHGETRGEAYGVIDLVLLLSAHLVIVAVVVVLGTYALRVVVCLVFQVTERERPGREAVLSLKDVSRLRTLCKQYFSVLRGNLAEFVPVK